MTLEERLSGELDKLEEKVAELKEENDNLRSYLPWTEHVDKEKDDVDLPIPRLEMLWEKLEPRQRGYNWKATQYLVYRHFLGHLTCVPLGSTMTMRGEEPPIHDARIELPFRDGAHIRHNAGQLRLPAYARVGDRIETLEPLEENND